MNIYCKHCGAQLQAVNTPPSILWVGFCANCNKDTTVAKYES